MVTRTRTTVRNQKPSPNGRDSLKTMSANEAMTTLLLARSKLLNRAMDDKRRDLNAECGYPEDGELTASVYRQWYEREGLATRVCNVLPDECFSILPEMTETDDQKETEFEKAWKDLDSEIALWHYIHRIDVASGIGSFGLLYYALDDGQALDKPVLDNFGKRMAKKPHKVMYLRVFDQSLVEVEEWETGLQNPRNGQPKYYSITFADPTAGSLDSATQPDNSTKVRVHWSRVAHIADNRLSNELFGIPRMKPVINRLYDCRKILGGSGEMFWRGAQPGWAFSAENEAGAEVEFDSDSLKEQWDMYSNGLQRYLALVGLKPHSLAPQVADPSNHLNQQIASVCATMGVPVPVFLGQIEGHMAGQTNTVMWNRRLGRRQTGYLHPLVISPITKRLIAYGVLPSVKSFNTVWSDLNSISDKDKADVALKKAQALLQYVTSGAETVFPVTEFFSLILGLPLATAQSVAKAASVQKQKTKQVWAKAQNSPGNPNNSGGKKPKSTRASRNSLG